jgi:hypothetical protein
MKNANTVLWVVAALCVGAGVAWHFKRAPEAQPPPLVSIEKMGHLVSVKVNYADIVDFTLPRELAIPGTNKKVHYGGTTVLLIAKGDCSVATDLRLAKYDAVDTTNRRLTVVLPLPTTLDARVNHSAPEQGGSHLYAIKNNGLEALIPDQTNHNEAIDKAFATAETRVASACMSATAIDAAKQNAENVLRGMFKATGWDVVINWR